MASTGASTAFAPAPRSARSTLTPPRRASSRRHTFADDAASGATRDRVVRLDRRRARRQMASDGNWVSAPAKRRGLVDYVKLKYYHWCLWTGIYMLDTRERAALNSIVLVLLALLARYVHHLFFLGEL